MPEPSKIDVLYVDDEEINLVIFREMFRGDFNVIPKSSPYEALEFLRENKVDVIVTDHRMPKMNGVEFLRELRLETDGNLPKRIMVSGFTNEVEIKNAVEEKWLDLFVSKPWTYDELKNAISQ